MAKCAPGNHHPSERAHGRNDVTMRKLCRLAVLAAILLVTISCSPRVAKAPLATSGERSGVTSEQTTKTFDSLGAVNALLFQIRSIVARSVTIQAATLHLEYICLSSHGFDVPAEAQARPTAPTTETEPLRFEAVPFEELNRGKVLELGYDAITADVAQVDQSPSPFDKWFASLSPTAQSGFQSVDGSEESGCVHESLQAVYDDTAKYSQLVALAFEAPNGLITRALVDPSYVSTVERWHACVSRKGFSASSMPEEMPQKVTDLHDTQLAIADWDCRVETGVQSARNDAYLRAANSPQQRDELFQLDTEVGTFLKAAEERAVGVLQ